MFLNALAVIVARGPVFVGHLPVRIVLRDHDYNCTIIRESVSFDHLPFIAGMLK